MPALVLSLAEHKLCPVGEHESHGAPSEERARHGEEQGERDATCSKVEWREHGARLRS
jgi:hypothetical protein